MLGSITPLGERGRGQRYWVTVGSFAVAATAAGAGLGAALGAIGGLLPGASWRPWLAVVAIALAALLDVLGARLPGPRRQVDEEWLRRYRGWVYGAGFGGQLGLGVTTFVTTAGTYAMLVCVLAVGSAPAGVAIAGAYGVARALALLPGARVRTTRSLGALTRSLARLDRPALRLAATTNVGLAAALVVPIVA